MRRCKGRSLSSGKERFLNVREAEFQAYSLGHGGSDRLGD
jgi:hypothetical protein